MTEFWTQVEGEAISENYRLGARLEETPEGAVYLTDTNALVKLHHANAGDADTLLDRWSGIARLSHPHLAQIMEAGRCELNGEPFVYAVMERAEETLAGVLSDRALSPEETLEMLTPSIDALAYIHANGYVHGSFQPSNILALGDSLKLSSDTLIPSGQPPAPRARTPYDAPELDTHVTLPASDVWSLGATTLEALTQRFRHDDDVLRTLPHSFADLIRHTLQTDPEQRWTLLQVAAGLHEPVAEAAPEPVPTAAKPPVVPNPPNPDLPPAPPPAANPQTHKWPLAAGAIALLGIAIFFFSRKPEPTPPQPPQQVAQTAVSNPEPAPTVKPPVTGAGTWCVVVATYNQRAAAEKRARETSRRWPRFKAQVLDPRGGKQHLVVLGSGLSQAEAEALRKRARSAGLSRDVFIVKIPG